MTDMMVLTSHTRSWQSLGDGAKGIGIENEEDRKNGLQK